MKALYFSSHGGPEQLIFGDYPNDSRLGTSLFSNPPPKGHVTVNIKYSSLNHLDLWVLKGWKGLNLELPHIGGADCLGKIVDINPEDNALLKSLNLEIASPVACNPGFLSESEESQKSNLKEENLISLGREELSKRYQILGESALGTFAEKIIVPISSIRKIEDKHLTAEVAASLLVGLTSYRMLVERARLVAGETVLIVGAGGGVNSFTIKLAKFLGANVIALTSSEEKEKQAKLLGADHTIDYTKDLKWSDTVKQITNGFGSEIVIDNVGEKTITQSLRAASYEGRIITVGNTSGHKLEIDNRIIFTKQLSLIGSTMGSFKTFDKVLELITKENITSLVNEILPLEQGRKGYEILEKGSQFGKVVFRHY